MSKGGGGRRWEGGSRKKKQVAQRSKSTSVNLSSDQNVTRAGMADELPFSAPVHGKEGEREKERGRDRREKEGGEDNDRSGKWGSSAGRIREGRLNHKPS